MYFSKNKCKDKKTKTSKYSQYVNKIEYRLNIVFKKLQERKKNIENAFITSLKILRPNNQKIMNYLYYIKSKINKPQFFYFYD